MWRIGRNARKTKEEGICEAKQRKGQRHYADLQ